MNSVLKNTLEFFKVARLFNPRKALEMNLDAAAIDCLGTVPFFEASTIANLKTELPQYLQWQRLLIYLQTMIFCNFGN